MFPQTKLGWTETSLQSGCNPKPWGIFLPRYHIFSEKFGDKVELNGKQLTATIRVLLYPKIEDAGIRLMTSIGQCQTYLPQQLRYYCVSTKIEAAGKS